MITINLTKAEQQLAILCGSERHIQNRQNGTDYHKVNFTNDINGIAAEIAVAKYCNRFPDLSIGPQRGGADLKIAGKTVDVKTTGKNPGYLQASLNKTLDDSDVYLLVTANFPTFTIQGGATNHQLLNKTTIKDTGYGKKYTLEQSQLSSLPHLFKKKEPFPW